MGRALWIRGVFRSSKPFLELLDEYEVSPTYCDLSASLQHALKVFDDCFGIHVGQPCDSLCAAGQAAGGAVLGQETPAMADTCERTKLGG